MPLKMQALPAAHFFAHSLRKPPPNKAPHSNSPRAQRRFRFAGEQKPTGRCHPSPRLVTLGMFSWIFSFTAIEQ